MATEHFCLRWNNHQSTLISVFDNLLESGTLVDCTLAADGRYLKAHKVVLSACSPYLGMLLSQHYDKHPIIILKDVKFEELKAMLDYMYRGEVNISQEQLSTFLKAAETLQIKGLTDTGGDEGNGVQPNRPPSGNSTTSLPDPQSPAPTGEGGNSPTPRKRRRNKHNDDLMDSESQAKFALSDVSDRFARDGVSGPGTPTNPLSALKNVSFGSVKREPSDVDGDGQTGADESGDGSILSRPGPSNGSGSSNKGSPWVLSADSTGEEMQLTPGQDVGGQENKEIPVFSEESLKEESESNDSFSVYSSDPLAINSGEIAKLREDQDCLTANFAIYNKNYNCEQEMIIPDVYENGTAKSKNDTGADLGNVVRLVKRVLYPKELKINVIPSLASNTYLNKCDGNEPMKITLRSNGLGKNGSILGLTKTDSSLSFQDSIVKADRQSAIKKYKVNLEGNKCKTGCNSSSPCPRILKKSTFRKILPAPSPSIVVPQSHKTQISLNPTMNGNDRNPFSKQDIPSNGITSVPFTFSIQSPIQTVATSSQTVQNSIGLQIAPQITISPSHVQGGYLTSSRSVHESSQVDVMSLQQSNVTNVVQQTVAQQNIIINRSSRPVSQTRFPTSKATGTNVASIRPKPNRQGKVSSIPSAPKAILPKILPKPDLC